MKSYFISGTILVSLARHEKEYPFDSLVENTVETSLSKILDTVRDSVKKEAIDMFKRADKESIGIPKVSVYIKQFNQVGA